MPICSLFQNCLMLVAINRWTIIGWNRKLGKKRISTKRAARENMLFRCIFKLINAEKSEHIPSNKVEIRNGHVFFRNCFKQKKTLFQTKKTMKKKLFFFSFIYILLNF